MSEIVDDVKRAAFILNVLFQITYITYLIYALAVGAGFLWANIIFGVLSVGYFVFYLLTYGKNDRTSRKVKSDVKHVKKWTVLTVKLVTIALTVYGIYIATTRMNFISVSLAVFSIVVWGIQLVIEIIGLIIEDKKELIMTGFYKDMEPFIKAKSAVDGVVGWIKGEEKNETPKGPVIKQKKLNILERRLEKVKAEKAAAKEEKKQKKEEAKAARRAAKSDAGDKEPLTK